MTLDFTGEGTVARDAFLYFFLDDGRFVPAMTANIGELPPATERALEAYY